MKLGKSLNISDSGIGEKTSPMVGDHLKDADDPRECDHPKAGDTFRICQATFYDVARTGIMLVLSTKPFYKLTGTDRQTDRQSGRQADKPTYWEACASKTENLHFSKYTQNYSANILA